MAALRYWLSTRIDCLVSWHYIRRLWGPRCPGHPDCPVCEQWREHDELFAPPRPTGSG